MGNKKGSSLAVPSPSGSLSFSCFELIQFNPQVNPLSADRGTVHFPVGSMETREESFPLNHYNSDFSQDIWEQVKFQRGIQPVVDVRYFWVW